jgi:hypothetical protein
LTEALTTAGVYDVRRAGRSFRGRLAWRTLVYGLIRREVDETVAVSVHTTGERWELGLDCRPDATHAAHAAGAGGVLLLSATVWLATGWSAGVVPGVTTAIAGGLWADVARVMALAVLERRLRRLAEDLGSALWPGVPAQILPPPSRIGRR